MGYFQHQKDSVIVNKDRNIAEAKRKVLELAADYVQKQPRKDVLVLGRGGLSALYVAAHSLQLGNYATEHDIKAIDLRGVKSGGVIKTLLEKRLIRITGRKEVVGRPMLYGTTKEFLLHFGLKDLGELPKIEEFAEVLGEEVDVAGLKRAIEAPRPVEVPLVDGEGDSAQGELPLEVIEKGCRHGVIVAQRRAMD